jgi:hypothetical protein
VPVSPPAGEGRRPEPVPSMTVMATLMLMLMTTVRAMAWIEMPRCS